jgi:hypothetical protein
VDFIIVVNPASGPGSGPLPDREFTREITRLNQYPNVRTIGYVAVDYGKKPPEKALADMDKYASWPTLNPNLAMQGIFLDESPQLADAANTTYMERVRAKVKSLKELSAGLLGTYIRFAPALWYRFFFDVYLLPPLTRAGSPVMRPASYGGFVGISPHVSISMTFRLINPQFPRI